VKSSPTGGVLRVFRWVRPRLQASVPYIAAQVKEKVAGGAEEGKFGKNNN